MRAFIGSPRKALQYPSLLQSTCPVPAAAPTLPQPHGTPERQFSPRNGMDAFIYAPSTNVLEV